MEEMMSGTMNVAFESAARQLFALALTGAICAISLMMTACFTAGIIRRFR